MAENPSASRPTFVNRDPLITHCAFDLVRNPSLLPSDRGSQVKTFWQLIEQHTTQLKEIGVLSGLQPQQQNELAALVLDFDLRHKAWSNAKDHFRQLKAHSQSGPGHVRKLARKLDRIRVDLQAAASGAQRVDVFVAELVVRHIDEALKALATARAKLIPHGETVRQYTARLPGWYEQSRSQHVQADDPQREAATRLVSHLRGCGLGSAEARVRAARIGNARWGWKYKISETDPLGETDCPSLRIFLSPRRALPKSPIPRPPALGTKTSRRQRTSGKKSR